MTTTRLLRSSKPLHHVGPPNTASSPFTSVKCVGKATGFNGDKMVSGDHGDHKRKSTVAVKASVAASKDSLLTVEPPRVFERGLIDLASLLATVSNALRKVLRPPALKPKLWKFQVQKLIEKVIYLFLSVIDFVTFFPSRNLTHEPFWFDLFIFGETFSCTLYNLAVNQ